MPGSDSVSLQRGLQAGNPSGLFTGYIKEEQAKGSHLDVPPILGFAAIGLAAGLYITYKASVSEAEERTEAVPLPPRHSAPDPPVSNNGVVSLSKARPQRNN